LILRWNKCKLVSAQGKKSYMTFFLDFISHNFDFISCNFDFISHNSDFISHNSEK